MSKWTVPPDNELEDKTIEELRELLDKWGYIYSKRFELGDHDHDYAMEIRHFYISCSMMYENLKNGWRRWWRITIPVSEIRFET
jgi:hypothetical protein